MKPTVLDSPAAAVRRSCDEVVLRLAEDPTVMLDLLGVPLATLVAEGRQAVVLDLTEVARMSRLGVGVLLAVRRAVVGYGGRVSVRGVNAEVLELFRRTGLDLLFRT
jgi:ABC-type transporter Mla MlaB component